MRELYLKRWRADDWDEKEDRDYREFLELEKEIYLEMYPQNAELFDEEEEEVDKEQAKEKKKRHGEQAKKKKVVGQAKNKKQVRGRCVTELVELSSDSDNGGGDQQGHLS